MGLRFNYAEALSCGHHTQPAASQYLSSIYSIFMVVLVGAQRRGIFIVPTVSAAVCPHPAQSSLGRRVFKSPKIFRCFLQFARLQFQDYTTQVSSADRH